MLGFFTIINNKRVSIKLKVPRSIKIHNVLHINLLWKLYIDLMTN